MSIWRWGAKFFDGPASARVTLGEGNTPLVRSRRLGPSMGLERLYFKLEMTNPTGSYKDRFAVAAVANMIAAGKDHCLATSSGNTGSSLAAYCAAAGMRCEIAIVESAPADKLRQMMAYGATIYRIRGFGIDPEVSMQTFLHLKRLADHPKRSLEISAFHFAPKGMAGVQTIGYELAEQAPEPIDHVFCPAGGGGLVVATVTGLSQMRQDGTIGRMPRVECVQPVGNDTMATPLRQGATSGREIQCTTTISGLQVPTVVDGDAVIAACRSSGGTGHLVTDDEVYGVQGRLAREDGIFTEPAGAVSVAGALAALREGKIDRNAMIVCLITGSGFKDRTSVDRMLAGAGAGAECPMIDIADLAKRK